MRRLRDNVLHNLGHAFWERNKNFGLVWGGGRGRDLSVLNVSGKDYRRLPSGALSCYLSVFIRIHICACVYRTVCVRSYVWRYFIHVGLQRFSLVPCQAQPLVCVSLTRERGSIRFFNAVSANVVRFLPNLQGRPSPTKGNDAPPLFHI